MITKTRVAAAIIQDGKLLMLKWHGYDELWTPWGKMDEWESNEECLARELKEELGIDLISAIFFKTYSWPSFYHPENTTVQHIYVATIQWNIIPDAEIESYIWLTKDDFINKLFPMIPITQEEIIPDLITANIF